MKHSLVIAVILCGGVVQTLFASASNQQEPKRSQDWFRRASESMALRLPGSKPFHLRVKFHAYAGNEILGPDEKSKFIVGDGVYDEIWQDPRNWRREVTLAEYHAVEAESNGERKMQASTDYEPSRVLMLLQYLSTPVPEILTNGSLVSMNWKIDHVSSGSLSLVRLSNVMAASQRVTFTDSYLFSEDGELTMSNVDGVVVAWSDSVDFGGKKVPKGLSVRCGDRDLLKANISIEPAGPLDGATSKLPGDAAEAGMTLQRPNGSAVKFPGSRDAIPPLSGIGFPLPPFIVKGVLDRSGAYREVELIFGQDDSKLAKILDSIRAAHVSPAMVGHSVCEVAMSWRSL